MFPDFLRSIHEMSHLMRKGHVSFHGERDRMTIHGVRDSVDSYTREYVQKLARFDLNAYMNVVEVTYY